MERAGEGGEVWDELPIEIAESNKRLDCFYQLGRFPIPYCHELCGVHMDFPILDYETYVDTPLSSHQRHIWSILGRDLLLSFTQEPIWFVLDILPWFQQIQGH